MSELQQIKQMLQNHLEAEAELRASIKKIEENHLAHIQASMSDFAVHLATLTANLDWLMRFFWIVASSSIGALIVAMLGLILK